MTRRPQTVRRTRLHASPRSRSRSSTDTHRRNTSRVRLHYSARLDATAWESRYLAGEVPDRWPYGLHRLSSGGTELQPVPRRLDTVRRISRRAAGGYEWDRLTVGGEAAVCWDERAGVPVALSGVPTLTGVIWLTERRRRHWTDGLARVALNKSIVFVLSPHQIDDLTTQWGLPPSRVHFVPFGVDTDFWVPTVGAREGVLTVGNDRHRDHHTAVGAALRTGRRCTVVTSSQDLPVRTVQLSHAELRQAYADHAVVAIATVPNRHASGVTVALEAMACGRPVVATRGGGLEAYITPETGELVEPGDVDGMTRALERLLHDPDRCLEMGRAARAQASAAFSTQVFAESINSLVSQL